VSAMQEQANSIPLSSTSVDSRASVQLGGERNALRRASRTSSLTAFGLATAFTASACASAYSPLADRLSLAGAEATLIFALLAIAGLPIVALMAVFRPLLWRGKVRGRQHELARRRFVEQYVATMQASDLQRLKHREQGLLARVIEAERNGSDPGTAAYARVLELIIVFPLRER
jgi:hypothetical protein